MGLSAPSLCGAVQVARGEFTWALLCDVDEYVFMPSDTKRHFLHRLLQRQQPSVSQVLLLALSFSSFVFACAHSVARCM